MPLTTPIVFEQGDKFYFVGPVAPVTPSTQDIEEYAFGKSIISSLREKAPNEHIAWFAGHYVEADIPNRNGAQWRSSEIAVKALTPTFMPVTVMHDPRTAVGLIADTRLLTPENAKVPRAKIDTALALWAHRFPEAVEEAQHNYATGGLMQSMECLAPDYECGSCGQVFHKLPDGAEREFWCAHLKGEEGETAVRTLRNVVFTGTGLIYGSRGAQGADPEAHLESFQEEVAEFHTRAHAPSKSKSSRKRSTPKMDEVTIAKAEYDRLVKDRDDAVRDRDAANAKIAEVEAEKAQAIKDSEKAEADKVAAEEKATQLQAKLTDAEETARKQTLRDERFESLGEGFTAKLGEKTKERLKAQAESLSDEEWTARLDEIEEMVGVKRDEGGKAADKDASTFEKTEVARFQGGTGTPAGASAPSETARRSVVAGLLK